MPADRGWLHTVRRERQVTDLQMARSTYLKLAIRTMIRAGTPEEINPTTGEWLFVDVGFSSRGRSCGILGSDNLATAVTFSEAAAQIKAAGSVLGEPLNLLIEALLSVAFNSSGNPVGRSFERLGSQHRYWYEGLGCVVMTSALYLLRGLNDSQPQREVRLFEGFVTFKPRDIPSSHRADVEALRAVVFDGTQVGSRVIAPSEFPITATDLVVSAFAVAGLDFGVPPVVAAMANLGLRPAAAGEIMSRRG